MATIEYLEKRVQGKEKEIAKLEQKVERILKAKATGWTNNPYYYNENDLKWAERDLEKAKAALIDYKDKLDEANARAASRNVQVIIDFLNQWKEESRQYYLDNVEPYLQAKQVHREKEHEYIEWWNTSWHWRKEHKDEAKQLERDRDRACKMFRETWGWIEDYMDYRNNLDEEKLIKDLNNEADRKYDFIIDRTVAKVGQITSADDLHITAGNLNGYIDGENGRVKVQTIGAGGYNIQRFHFRTLVK